jgi:hypothetical protein
LGEREKRSGSSGRQESTIGRGRERREGAHREESTIGCERQTERRREGAEGGSVGGFNPQIESHHQLKNFVGLWNFQVFVLLGFRGLINGSVL